MKNYTERRLFQISANRDPNKIDGIFWEEGQVGWHKWASKPTGVTIKKNDNLDLGFLNAFIAQQLPNASVHIKWLTRN